MGGEADDDRKSDANANGSPATVRVTVPEYQLTEWATHADDIEMTTSEFVRSMVQAGRRGFDETAIAANGGTDTGGEPGGATDLATAGPTNGLRYELLEALSTGEYRSWEELREHVVDAVETSLDTELRSLLDEGLVDHSPREDGYRLVE